MRTLQLRYSGRVALGLDIDGSGSVTLSVEVGDRFMAKKMFDQIASEHRSFIERQHYRAPACMSPDT